MNKKIKTFYVNASNCHQGGGKTLLDGFIEGLTESEFNYVFFLDKRYKNLKLYNSNNIKIIYISKILRFIVYFLIKKKIKYNDVIFYFGNLPPIFNFKNNKVILMLSTRFYVDKLPFYYYPSLLIFFKVFFENIYFHITYRNVDKVIVQTETMKRLLLKISIKKEILILPYDDFIEKDIQINIQKKDNNSFIYVASLYPYKNHKRLLKAWKILKDDNIKPILYLTIDNNNNLKKWITNYIFKNNLNNIHLLENISRTELKMYYEKCEFLIYPSFFESYGLPIIEAKKFNLKIITSDSSFCFDLIKPDDFFNPYDCDSIARSVKRNIGLNKITNMILTPINFVNKFENI